TRGAFHGDRLGFAEAVRDRGGGGADLPALPGKDREPSDVPDGGAGRRRSAGVGNQLEWGRLEGPADGATFRRGKRSNGNGRIPEGPSNPGGLGGVEVDIGWTRVPDGNARKRLSGNAVKLLAFTLCVFTVC